MTDHPPRFCRRCPSSLRYVRLLGAFYLRLVGNAKEIYQYLEPLYHDFRKLRKVNESGTFGLVHNLLNQEETAKALTENPVVDLLQDIEQRFAGPAAPQERQSFNHHYHPKDIQY